MVAKLPFAEDLLAAYYCAFDRQTPRHVQAALLGAIAYFILPFDFIPDMLPVLGFTDDAAIQRGLLRARELGLANFSVFCNHVVTPAAIRPGPSSCCFSWGPIATRSPPIARQIRKRNELARRAVF